MLRRNRCRCSHLASDRGYRFQEQDLVAMCGQEMLGTVKGSTARHRTLPVGSCSAFSDRNPGWLLFRLGFSSSKLESLFVYLTLPSRIYRKRFERRSCHYQNREFPALPLAAATETAAAIIPMTISISCLAPVPGPHESSMGNRSGTNCILQELFVSMGVGKLGRAQPMLVDLELQPLSPCLTPAEGASASRERQLCLGGAVRAGPQECKESKKDLELEYGEPDGNEYGNTSETGLMWDLYGVFGMHQNPEPFFRELDAWSCKARMQSAQSTGCASHATPKP